MAKYEWQHLKNALDFFSSEHFPRISSQLTPSRRKNRAVFPFYGSDDSKAILALKMMAMYGIKKKTTTKELVKKFYRMNRRKQLFIAYNLSHELKIASLAASIAMKKQDSNVYEIGACFGFSSLHYSRLLKEKNLNSKQVNRLTVIESNKGFVEQAKTLKKITGDYVGEIEYIHGDGINYVRKTVRNDDVIFSSIATPSVVNGIFGLSNFKSVNIIISYSERTNDKMAEIHGQCFENALNANVYDVFPFEDKEYEIHVLDDIRKMGVVALPIST